MIDTAIEQAYNDPNLQLVYIHILTSSIPSSIKSHMYVTYSKAYVLKQAAALKDMPMYELSTID